LESGGVKGMSAKLFLKDTVYENVYLVFVDASGHSNVVRSNPKDVADQAFDLLFEKIDNRLKRVATKHRCERALIWSWLGDGGLVAIHDNSEQKAVVTALEFVQDILNLDLPALKSEFENESINGELHIRTAVHKGTIKYTDDGQQGFIHSSDINWGAHLEKATPRDSISISKEIYDILHKNKKALFSPVGTFEEREVYVFTPNASPKQILRSWRSARGFNEMELVQCYLERLSQRDKAELIDLAEKTVIDFGTTLNTCSNYLFSTERPLPYRDAVLRLLERGGSFICYMLTPDSNGSRQLVELRKEDTDEKLCAAMERFQQFKKSNPSVSKNFKVFQYEDNPNFAAMIIDPELDDAVCLYSPYLSVLPQGGTSVGRADMPHYLGSKKRDSMYDYVWNFVSAYMDSATEFL
jgi:hypothetical protein